jgi:hypothetical protein
MDNALIQMFGRIGYYKKLLYSLIQSILEIDIAPRERFTEILLPIKLKGL